MSVFGQIWAIKDVNINGTVYLGWGTVRQVTEKTFEGLESAHLEIVEITYMRSGDAVAPSPSGR